MRKRIKLSLDRIRSYRICPLIASKAFCQSCIAAFFCALALNCLTALAEDRSINTQTAHEHSEIVNQSNQVYSVQLNGTMDGVNTRDPIGYQSYEQSWEPNKSLRMENIGNQLVKNPWILVNGKRDWRSLDAILDGIIEEGYSEKDKALAIWEFARKHRYHTTTADDEVKDTVKMLNIYGYTLCWDEAYTVSNLWQTAGLKTRSGVPHGHCTTEVYFDGDYHLLCSDEHLLYLLRDNKTIANEEDLARDHDLVKRGHAFGILAEDNQQKSEVVASLFTYTGPRSGSRPLIDEHSMEFDLRPGEALIWKWENLNKYHGYDYVETPARVANGLLQYTPRLDAGFEQWTESAVNLAAKQNSLKAIDPAKESSLVYRIHSPYVIVGGRIELNLSNTAQSIDLEISLDDEHWESLSLDHKIGNTVKLSVDNYFHKYSPARYFYWIRLRGKGIDLQKLTVETDLQMAPLSLPSLELGENKILYTDDTEGDRLVRLTHAWEERIDSEPPQSPAEPISPAFKSTVAGTEVAFAWAPVEHAIDYHFQLGESHDLNRCLSPTFDRLISRTPYEGKAEWTVPHVGLLNPDQTYYWRVRARNSAGLWSSWSSVWEFKSSAPGIPLALNLNIDDALQRGSVHWQANPRGNAVDHYEVYGSNEQGFTASREPYQVFAGRDTGFVTFPANLLNHTPKSSLQVIGPDIPEENGNRYFYRVIAVDKEGIRSGPSDLVAMERPFIYSKPPQTIRTDAPSAYQLRLVKSIGDLRSNSKGPARYFSAFRGADKFDFHLDEGPDWIALDKNTGLLEANPHAQDIGIHQVTIRIQKASTIVAVQGFNLRVIN